MINVPTYNTHHAVRNTITEKTDLKLLKDFSYRCLQSMSTI